MNDIAFGFTIANTHLYKGCPLKQHDELPSCSTSPAPIRIEFSDGTIVIAHIFTIAHSHLRPTELEHKSELQLAIPAYQTAAKTNIKEKTWLIRPKNTLDWTTIKLLPAQM